MAPVPPRPHGHIRVKHVNVAAIALKQEPCHDPIAVFGFGSTGVARLIWS
jgi:hypothetical protein